ncbi:acyl-CoA carboxylase subunit epsilon [Nocardioides sp.]|uniref:acyl-CoA carboxylase subunit epsilon n=1 Tax=Nocardioides sp. TaxID=35761 RepID=UPI00272400FE|nr:acyl-CoA carboxylase subunit epsilon [Nocardioides sp.]MDO9457060.1 acyl-CoA carboxylase subunit epsilon [Nocardioides sp.]
MTDDSTDESTDESTAPEPARPLLRIVGSDATPEEVAAIVAVFSALGGGEPPAPRRRPTWGAPDRQVRRTLPHGPGGWRASSLPR